MLVACYKGLPILSSAEASEKNGRRFTLGRFVIIVICLLLAYCGQKEIRLTFVRSEAQDICEAGGGGKLQSSGPIEVEGYYSTERGGLGGAAWLLLMDGFKFVESAGEPKPRLGARSAVIRHHRVFSRYTVVPRPSLLCEKWDRYLGRLEERSTSLLSSEVDNYRRMGLKESECVGVETFSDPGLLKSRYAFRKVKISDQEFPRIEWTHHQVVVRATEEVVSEISVFGQCLDGFFQAEPFYSGCKGGNKNYARCPFDRPHKDSPDNVNHFYNNAITAKRN
jgi:hypothetical protein